MKKSTLISIVSLLVALAGLLVALAAYLKRNKCVVCDDLSDDLFYEDDDDDIEYYATQIHPTEKNECGCPGDCDCEQAAQTQPQVEPETTDEQTPEI